MTITAKDGETTIQERTLHSPGPWEVRDGVVVSVPLDSVAMITLKGEAVPRATHNGIVAIVYGHHVGDDQPRAYTADANRNLIAKAPELLDAVNGLLGLIQLISGRHDIPADLPGAMQDNHRYRDAMALVQQIEGDR